MGPPHCGTGLRSPLRGPPCPEAAFGTLCPYCPGSLWEESSVSPTEAKGALGPGLVQSVRKSSSFIFQINSRSDSFNATTRAPAPGCSRDLQSPLWPLCSNAISLLSTQQPGMLSLVCWESHRAPLSFKSKGHSSYKGPLKHPCSDPVATTLIPFPSLLHQRLEPPCQSSNTSGTSPPQGLCASFPSPQTAAWHTPPGPPSLCPDVTCAVRTSRTIFSELESCPYLFFSTHFSRFVAP